MKQQNNLKMPTGQSTKKLTDLQKKALLVKLMSQKPPQKKK